jgi:hypothetical protein
MKGMTLRKLNTKRLGVLVPAALAFVAIGLLATSGAFAGSKPGKGGGQQIEICPDYGDWVYDQETGEWTLTGENDLGSKKFDVNGNLAELGVSAPNGYKISGYCVKAGTTTTVVNLHPPVASLVLSDEFEGKDISHFSLRFVKENGGDAEWCSPGFWRNNANKHGANQWPVSTDTKYNAVISDPTVAGDPSLLDVLNSPQTYGGAAFNAVGTYLSIEAGLNVQFDENGNPIHNCPLDQQGGEEEEE